MVDGIARSARRPDGPSRAAYSVTARTLHWVTAALVLIMLPLGLVIANRWGGSWQDWLYNLHRSIGAVVLIIILVRLGYRLTHQPLPLSDEIPQVQRRAAPAVHWTLYTLLLVQPLVGWAGSSAYPAPVILVGSAFVCAPIDCFGHRLPCGHPCRGRHLSSLCAPRWCLDAHGYWLTARWLEDRRCQNAGVAGLVLVRHKFHLYYCECGAHSAGISDVCNRGGQLATDRGDQLGDVALRPDRGRLGSITTRKGKLFSIRAAECGPEAGESPPFRRGTVGCDCQYT
jgi:cytochrome b561